MTEYQCQYCHRFHARQHINRATHYWTSQFDIIGIVSLMSSAAIPMIYYGLHGHTTEQRYYFAIVSSPRTACHLSSTNLTRSPSLLLVAVLPCLYPKAQTVLSQPFGSLCSLVLHYLVSLLSCMDDNCLHATERNQSH